MATAPVKPHPLHNFPLSLKWGQTAATPSAATSTATISHPDADHQQPDPSPARPTRVGSRSARLQRFSFSSCSTLLRPSPERQAKQTAVPEKPLKEVVVSGNDGNGSEVKGEGVEEEEENSRPWKLRPRMQRCEVKEAVVAAAQVSEPKSMRLRGLVESCGGGGDLERKEKRRFWIALEREEIEEDIFILTGSRPARRPKKRPRNVQRVLDVGDREKFFPRDS